jgi:hypothetical protein
MRYVLALLAPICHLALLLCVFSFVTICALIMLPIVGLMWYLQEVKQYLNNEDVTEPISNNEENDKYSYYDC